MLWGSQHPAYIVFAVAKKNKKTYLSLRVCTNMIINFKSFREGEGEGGKGERRQNIEQGFWKQFQP